MKFQYFIQYIGDCLWFVLIELGVQKARFTQTIVNSPNKTFFIVSSTSGLLGI